MCLSSTCCAYYLNTHPSSLYIDISLNMPSIMGYVNIFGDWFHDASNAHLLRRHIKSWFEFMTHASCIIFITEILGLERTYSYWDGFLVYPNCGKTSYRETLWRLETAWLRSNHRIALKLNRRLEPYPDAYQISERLGKSGHSWPNLS